MSRFLRLIAGMRCVRRWGAITRSGGALQVLRRGPGGWEPAADIFSECYAWMDNAAWWQFERQNFLQYYCACHEIKCAIWIPWGRKRMSWWKCFRLTRDPWDLAAVSHWLLGVKFCVLQNSQWQVSCGTIFSIKSVIRIWSSIIRLLIESVRSFCFFDVPFKRDIYIFNYSKLLSNEWSCGLQLQPMADSRGNGALKPHSVSLYCLLIKKF